MEYFAIKDHNLLNKIHKMLFRATVLIENEERMYYLCKQLEINLNNKREENVIVFSL